MYNYNGPGGTIGVNDQLSLAYTASALFPTQAQAPTWSGGMKTPPTLAYPTGLSQVGYPVGPGQSDMTSNAVAFPFSLQHSPALWAIIFILVGVWGLRHIHFRGID